jgi:hypothetical protein
MTKNDVERQRDHNYRRTTARQVRTEEQALAFVNEVGFCFLFRAPHVEAPTLWEAILGGEYHEIGHHDYETGLAWNWKDTLVVKKQIFYGKLLKQKPTLISLPLFPYFYALSENYGEPEEYLDDYEAGRLSYAAKCIYEVLLREGAMPTSTLRRQAGLAGDGDEAPSRPPFRGVRRDGASEAARLFDRGLAELQASLKIVKTGISDANRWKYCYVYDLLPRWLPEQVAAGLRIRSLDAMQTIIRQYLDVVVVSTPQKIADLFGWPPGRTSQALAALAATGEIRTGLCVEGLPGEWLARPNRH